jgi:uncharacterized protein YjbJ (UPF0337 family)
LASKLHIALLFCETHSAGDKEMAGKADQAKGRVKEAAGVLTDDDRLKREGKVDQAAGKVKEGAAKAVDKVKRAVKRNT